MYIKGLLRLLQVCCNRHFVLGTVKHAVLGVVSNQPVQSFQHCYAAQKPSLFRNGSPEHFGTWLKGFAPNHASKVGL